MVNGIDAEEKKQAVLLTVIGALAYSLLRNLVAPSKPASLSYGELNRALSAHLKLKPLIIAKGFRFHRRNQAEGGVPQYLAELRRLADRCKFGNHLEEALRLVCGIRNEGTHSVPIAYLGRSHSG